MLLKSIFYITEYCISFLFAALVTYAGFSAMNNIVKDRWVAPITPLGTA